MCEEKEEEEEEDDDDEEEGWIRFLAGAFGSRWSYLSQSIRNVE